MHLKHRALAIAALSAAVFALPAQAQTDIQWWHSMTAVNGEWVNDLAKEFNPVRRNTGFFPLTRAATTSR